MFTGAVIHFTEKSLQRGIGNDIPSIGGGGGRNNRGGVDHQPICIGTDRGCSAGKLIAHCQI